MKIKQFIGFSFAVITLFSVAQIYAASAVAWNKATGSYGYAYGKKTETEAKKIALENCQGGEIIASSAKDGYGAVLRNANNWKKEGQVIGVKGILAQTDPVATKKLDCADCLVLETWYDNALSTDAEKFEGSGSKKAPEVLTVDSSNRRDGVFYDLKLIDGREFRHGYGISYTDPELKTVMKSKTEYYMGLRDGVSYGYEYVEGQEPKVKYEFYFKEGWKTGINRDFFPNGALSEYIEFVKGVKNGPFYKFNIQGIVVKKGWYKNNLQHGMWYEYDDKGLLTRKGAYDFDKRNGEWTTYGSDGFFIKKKETFEQGMSVKMEEFKKPKTDEKPKKK